MAGKMKKKEKKKEKKKGGGFEIYYLTFGKADGYSKRQYPLNRYLPASPERFYDF